MLGKIFGYKDIPDSFHERSGSQKTAILHVNCHGDFSRRKKILSDLHETFGIYVKSYSKTNLLRTFFDLD